MKKADTLPIIAFATQQDWEAWLKEHHAATTGMWLKIAKKGSGIPDDFQRELDDNQQAQAFFATLNSVNRYAILFRIQTAKKSETRSARIKKFIEMLANQQKLYP